MKYKTTLELKNEIYEDQKTCECCGRPSSTELKVYSLENIGDICTDCRKDMGY